MATIPDAVPQEGQLPIKMTPEAFRRFVRGGQILKAASFLFGLVMLALGRVTVVDAALFAGFYVLTMLGITAGYHRLFSHRSYEAHPALRAVLAVLGTMSGQGTVLIWASTHRKHHQYTEQALDPHSPHHGDGPGWKKFWHSHVGWILNFFPQDWERYIPDLLQDKFLVALHKRSMLVVLAGLVLPGVMGGLVSHSWAGFWSGMLWGGWVRAFAVEQCVCLVNSAAHVWGRRPFQTRDQSANSWWIAMLVLGEGWHNGHHAFPASARHGLNRFEFDFTFELIRALRLFKLVDRMVLPEREAIAAKRVAAGE